MFNIFSKSCTQISKWNEFVWFFFFILMLVLLLLLLLFTRCAFIEKHDVSHTRNWRRREKKRVEKKIDKNRLWERKRDLTKME